MHRLIQADLNRYTGDCAGWKSLRRGFRDPGFRFMYAFRQACLHRKYTLRGLFFRFLVTRYFWKYGFQISLKTPIGEGLYIGHIGSIIINSNSSIGRNCNLSPGVTIGQTNRGEKMGCPRIGDRVWFGTNSVVVGRITIGSNVLIAPGAFVNFDVPDNSIVIGNPAKVIPSAEATAGYIENILA